MLSQAVTTKKASGFYNVACAVAIAFCGISARAEQTEGASSERLNARLHEHHNLRDLNDLRSTVKQAEGAYAKASRIGKKAEIDATRSQLLGALQALAFAQSVSGDSPGAIKTFDRESIMWEKFNGTSTSSSGDLDLSAIDASIAKEAISELTRAALSRQVVILNEAHHVEMGRAFAMQLARSLRQIGYRYLACETFRVDSDPSTMEYVGESAGYYSRAPMFATFLSDALAEGWTFVSYEPNGSGNGSRDFQMASNLVDRIFIKDPKARVFVYVGYSHARKYPKSFSSTDGSKFAAQLKRLTGIDPLTIDQTTFYDHYDSKQQQVYYRHAALKLHGLNPQVLVDTNGHGLTLSNDDRSFEYYVIYPFYELDSATGRPTWMKLPALGAMLPTTIPAEFLTSKFERLVYAYPADSPSDAAPLDVVRILPGQPVPKLMLPSGKEFTFEFED